MTYAHYGIGAHGVTLPFLPGIGLVPKRGPEPSPAPARAPDQRAARMEARLARVLLALRREWTRSKDIAAELDIGRSRLSRAIVRLAADGLVESREENSGFHRQTLHRLTLAGLDVRRAQAELRGAK